MELTSPRINPEFHRSTRHPFQSNWTPFGCRVVPEVGVRVADAYDNNMVIDPSQGGDFLLLRLKINHSLDKGILVSGL